MSVVWSGAAAFTAVELVGTGAADAGAVAPSAAAPARPRARAFAVRLVRMLSSSCWPPLRGPQPPRPVAPGSCVRRMIDDNVTRPWWFRDPACRADALAIKIY